MDNLDLYIEALVFSSEQSLRLEEIAYCLQASLGRDCSVEDINEGINNIQKNTRILTWRLNWLK